MERFCSKCGSLVEGTGMFCPSCGEKLGSAVNLEKPDAMPSISQPVSTQPMSTFTQSDNNNTYGNQNSHVAQMPNYPQSYNSVSTPSSGEMTVGQWVLTIFLSSLGLIGLILLFVWAFGDTNTAKKNYARAMLIWEAITLAIVIIIYIGAIVCSVGLLGSIFEELGNELEMYAMFR
ncbi:MAG: zinc ribbon domain-containing protein [Oscillospiraceae bacterium]|nr:zinc ribbon domain-containing protein [Oscillospiraceae bacterium]